MARMRSFSKPATYVMLLGALALTLHIPATHAGLIATEAVLAPQSQAHRDRLHAALEREEVRQALRERGVDPSEVATRVDALTDAEAQQLASRLDALPAGGDALALAVFVFLVLLLTDILGYTDIFPFVKKPAR